MKIESSAVLCCATSCVYRIVDGSGGVGGGAAAAVAVLCIYESTCDMEMCQECVLLPLRHRFTLWHAFASLSVFNFADILQVITPHFDTPYKCA